MNKYKKYYMIIVIFLFSIFMCLYMYVGYISYDVFISKDTHYPLVNISSKSKISGNKWYKDHSKLIELQSHDHLSLSASYINQHSSKCIMMVHGYRNDKVNLLPQVKEFYKRGYDLLIIDLRGHGNSEGSSIGMGVNEQRDIALWVKKLKSLNNDYDIVLYGVSMGASAILNCSDDIKGVKCIISDSAYADISDVFIKHSSLSQFEEMFVMNALRFVTFFKAGYDLNEAKPILHVGHTHIPVLYIHGSQDRIVPIKHMYNLYNHTQSFKDYYYVDEEHGKCYKDQYYFKTVCEFIEKYTP